MDNKFASNLKDKVNIIDIINDYVDLKKSGSNYKACCPFHKEKTPSFVVNEIKQSFKCFGCGKGGDVFTFIQEIENMSFFESIGFLADKMGIEVPRNNNSYDDKKYQLEKDIKDLNLFVGRYYYKNLVRNKKALDYLKNRGVSSDMIKAFGLGYADISNDLLNQLISRYPKEVIEKSGIISLIEGKSRLIFKDRIIFPIFNSKNEILAFGGRQLGDYGPKYLNSPETAVYSKKENLYGFNIAKKNISDGMIFLVEGYMDVISMHQNGYKNSVATLGTALTIEQAKMISKICSTIYILYDTDSAGINATKRALDIIVDLGVDCRVITLIDAKDPDEYFKKFGNKNFYRNIELSDDYLMFNIKYIKNKFDINTTIGKDNFVSESVKFIKDYINKPYAKQIYLENTLSYISNVSGYSIKSIGVDIFGKYFSTKQFKGNKENNRRNINISNFDDISEKENNIIYALKNKIISFDDIKINEFVLSESREKYFKILNNINVDIDNHNISTNNDYKTLIKSIRKQKYEMEIEYLEKQQAFLLEISPDDIGLAVKFTEKIISIKNILNKEGV